MLFILPLSQNFLGGRCIELLNFGTDKEHVVAVSAASSMPLFETRSLCGNYFGQVITEVPQEEVELTLVRADLGAVTQSDVEAASLAEAPIFAFNVGNVPPEVKVSHHRHCTNTYHS